MQQSTSGQRRWSVLKREGGGGGGTRYGLYPLTPQMFQIPFNFALFVDTSKPHCNLTVASVSVIDL